MSCGERATCCWTAFPTSAPVRCSPWPGGKTSTPPSAWGEAASCWQTTSVRISCPRTGCFARAFPVRFYMERPRHISRYMAQHFDTSGPLGQDKLFISRQGVPGDSASSILRAARAIKAGMLLYLAGDVRWTGQLTESARFLGPHHAIFDNLGRPGRDDRSAGRHGLLPDGARRPLPHRVSPRLSRPQGYGRTQGSRRGGSSTSSRSWKSRSAVIRATAMTISSGKSLTSVAA